MRVLKGIVCLLAVLFVAGAAAAAPQSDAQQACINKVNKAITKVQAAQGKANNSCVKDFVKGKISGPGAAEACVIDDPKDKVEGKQANLLNDEGKNCDPMDLPAFAYTNGTYAGTTAYQAEVNLIHDVYGSPLDSGLYLCDTFPGECLCQRQAIGRVEKLFRAMSKIFIKCKKPALAIGHDPFPLGAASASDIADCLDNGAVALSVEADGKGKVADGTTQLDDTLTHFCSGPFGNDPFSGGVCAGLTGPTLTSCLVGHTKCRFCQMFQATDNLGANVDCATYSGVTCP